MSGPMEPGMNPFAGLFGMPQGGAAPPMRPPKMYGDRVPTSTSEAPNRHPGQQQVAAAHHLGVRPHQAAPPDRPQSPTRSTQRGGGGHIPLPQPRPDIGTEPPAPQTQPPAQPPARGGGSIPMPQPRPPEAGPPKSPIATVLEGKLNPQGDVPYRQREPDISMSGHHGPNTFGDMLSTAMGMLPDSITSGPNAAAQYISDLIAGGPPTASAEAAEAQQPPMEGPVPMPQSRPSGAPTPKADSRPSAFDTGAPPVQGGPQELAKTLAKANQNRDAKSAPPSKTGYKKDPPEEDERVPAKGQEGGGYHPSTQTFEGYTVRPPKPLKGQPKEPHPRVLKKEDNPYYWIRAGAEDASGVKDRVKAVREKVADPRQVKKMTYDDDRIYATYGRPQNFLLPMDPDSVEARMAGYRAGKTPADVSGQPGGLPPKYDSGSQGGGGPVYRGPPKDPAAASAAGAIDNPPNRDATKRPKDQDYVDRSD